jgi:hypothetical protein
MKIKSQYFPPPAGIVQDKDVRAALANFVDRCGSQKIAAARLGIHSGYLSSVLKDRATIPYRVAFKLGFLPVWYYTGEKGHL